jgi:tetratricopeptide (TPR) repeat protein
VPADELSWIARAEARKDTATAAALTDVEEALKLNPLSLLGLRLKAHLLDKLDRPAEAIAALDLAVKHYPDNAPARAGRGVLLARAGKREAALQDARDALLRDTKAPNLYQVAGIYALTSRQEPEDRAEALRLLWSALKTGFGLNYVDTDTDLDPIRKHPEFLRLVSAAKAMHGKAPPPGKPAKAP